VEQINEIGSKASVYIRKGAGKSVLAGGAWVYDNEIERIDGNYANGDTVKVKDYKDKVIGLGFINDHSKIRVRILTRNKKEVIDANFFRKRLKMCWEYRKKVVDTACCRVVFGEADFLPGITIDKFSDVLVVQSLALGIDQYKELIVEQLKQILLEDGIAIRGVYERSDAAVRIQEGMELVKGLIGTEFDTKVQIIENGIKYNVDIVDGQKTGFFLDQKYNRLSIRSICKDARVLDCFTHTGSFGLNAAAGGAKNVLSVDISEHAIEQAQENCKLNGLNVDYLCANVFDLLPQWVKEGRKYDVIILDPPAFTKSKNATEGAIRGYKEINYRAMRMLEEDGYLVTCSCSHFMNPSLFAKTIAQAANDCGKYLRQVEFRTQAPDHPILWSSDESYYLKFYIFQVCSIK
jgi:23S rRNA (cytosine1962-C5)-methyltransferase